MSQIDPSKQEQVKPVLRKLLGVEGLDGEILLDYLAGGAPLPAEEWEALGELGRRLADAGQHERALQAYEKALALHRYDGVLWANYGRSLEALGKLQKALECYEKVPALRPDLPILPERARAYMQLGRFAEALSMFDTAVLDTPDTPMVLHNRAICLLQLERPEDALQGFERVLAIAPGHVAAARMKVEAHLALGQNEATAEAMHYFLSIFRPEDSAGCFEKGKMALESGFAKEAEESFRKLTEMEPQAAGAWQALGSALSQLERFQESEDAFRQGLKLDPSSVELLAACATVMLRSWQAELNAQPSQSPDPARREAILQCIREWQKKDPRAGQPWMSEGVFHQLKEDWESAITCFCEAAKRGAPHSEEAIAMAKKLRRQKKVHPTGPARPSGERSAPRKTSWLGRLFGQ